MKNTNIIRNFIFGNLILLISAVSVLQAAPVVRKSSGATPAAINLGVDVFRQDLGGANNGVGKSYPTGRREISWDDAPNVPTALSRNYYNTVSPRGVILASTCTDDAFRVSQISPSVFSDVNDGYENIFNPYSGQRIFAAYATGGTDCHKLDVNFYVPGTNTPATVSGFGLIFLDVDLPASASITCYGIGGEELAPAQYAVPANNGLSFLGVSFNNGERIARVRILSGRVPFGRTDGGNGGFDDVVAMDDFIYAEPRAIGQHASDFDGDGASDHAVFRPSNGTWYVMNSGSNTFAAAQFGTNGDVPIDGDFDGDSRNDFAVWRPSTGAWYILRSSNGQLQTAAFGQIGDKPEAGDYDRDGKSDIAVWRPSNGSYYYLKSSNGQFTATTFGTNGDIPIGTPQQ